MERNKNSSISPWKVNSHKKMFSSSSSAPSIAGGEEVELFVIFRTQVEQKQGVGGPGTENKTTPTPHVPGWAEQRRPKKIIACTLTSLG